MIFPLIDFSATCLAQALNDDSGVEHTLIRFTTAIRPTITVCGNAPKPFQLLRGHEAKVNAVLVNPQSPFGAFVVVDLPESMRTFNSLGHSALVHPDLISQVRNCGHNEMKAALPKLFTREVRWKFEPTNGNGKIELVETNGADPKQDPGVKPPCLHVSNMVTWFSLSAGCGAKHCGGIGTLKVRTSDGKRPLGFTGLLDLSSLPKELLGRAYPAS